MKTLLLAALMLVLPGLAKAAYTNVPSTAAPSAFAITPASFTFVASDVANGNSFTHSGSELLIVFNSDTAAHSITVASVADPGTGRTGDSTKNINAGAYYVFQLFPPLGWRQTDGTIHVQSTDATLKLAVIKLP